MWFRRGRSGRRRRAQRAGRASLREVFSPAGPFPKATGLPRLRAHWVHPSLVVQVAFLEWTGHGKMRHSRLLGVRRDKSPREVVREQA